MKDNYQADKKILIQDKSKFITDLLDYSIKRKIDDKTKERLINLISKEFDKAGIVETEIIERLIRIEGLVSNKSESSVGDKKTSSDKLPRPLHKPKDTKNFLSLFNNSEGLKYLTHKFNDGKRDYKKFIELCKSEFEKGKDDYPNVPVSLLKRIEEFAFSDNPKWYIRKGKYKIFQKKGWSELTFIDWYKKDLNIHPGLDAKWNNEMLIPFKETIEVRAGNLTKIIDESIEFAFGDSKRNFSFKINSDEINTAEFYTDVDSLQQALFHIFSTIKERSEKNLCFEINICYINETLLGGDFKKIIITHIDSEATKKSNDPEFAKGDLKTIQYYLWGLCNYELQAKFPDGYKKRILLTDNLTDYDKYVKTNNSLDVTKAEVLGFSHILKFY